MPVKNAAGYLNECIDSIISQSYENWELVAVDDHSEDDSLRILSMYAHRDTRISALINKGHGIIPGLQLAFKKCNGEMITRMDADDVMIEDKLLIMATDLQEYGKGHIAIGLVKYISHEPLGEGYKKYENWLNNLSKNGGNWEDIYKECVIPSPCWMVYKSDLDTCGAFDSHVYPEDYDLCFRMYSHDLKVIPTSKTLHYWRDHSERTSRNDPHYSENSFFPLKVKWFLSKDYDPILPLIIWGAGRKGKYVVRLFNKAKTELKWICENDAKIGKDIYGHKLHSKSLLDQFNRAQIILCVSNEKEQKEILEYLRFQHPLLTIYRFC